MNSELRRTGKEPDYCHVASWGTAVISGVETAQSCRWVPAFRRHIRSPYSGKENLVLLHAVWHWNRTGLDSNPDANSNCLAFLRIVYRQITASYCGSHEDDAVQTGRNIWTFWAICCPIFKVEDEGSGFVRDHRLVNVVITCWQSCWRHCIFPNLCVWHFAITDCRKLSH